VFDTESLERVQELDLTLTKPPKKVLWNNCDHSTVALLFDNTVIKCSIKETSDQTFRWEKSDVQMDFDILTGCWDIYSNL
jgi:hypothetical protein